MHFLPAAPQTDQATKVAFIVCGLPKYALGENKTHAIWYFYRGSNYIESPFVPMRYLKCHHSPILHF